jgi:hypothetical protein
MVNENYFQFDRKSFFNFRKNRKSFFEIKLFVLARTFDIRLSEFSNCRLSESSRRQSPTTFVHLKPASAGIQENSATVTRFRPKLARIFPVSNHGQKAARSGQNGRNQVGSGQNGRDPT